MSCLALPAAQRFTPFSGSTDPLSAKLTSTRPTPAKPAAMTPAAPARTTTTAPSTVANAAAEKKDFASLTSRTVAGPTAPGKAQNGARARDAKSMPKATGRWTAEEHDEFLKCLDIYGHNWTKAAERITTRTSAQIRSHFQKHFKKVQAAGETVSPPQAKKSGPPKFKGDPSCPDFEECSKALFPGKFRAHLPKCESCRNWAYRVSQLQAAPVGAFPTALTVVKHAAKVQDEEGVKFPGRIDVADFTARPDAAANAAKRKGAKGAAPPAKKPKK